MFPQITPRSEALSPISGSLTKWLAKHQIKQNAQWSCFPLRLQCFLPRVLFLSAYTTKSLASLHLLLSCSFSVHLIPNFIVHLFPKLPFPITSTRTAKSGNRFHSILCQLCGKRITWGCHCSSVKHTSTHLKLTPADPGSKDFFVFTPCRGQWAHSASASVLSHVCTPCLSTCANPVPPCL